MSSATPITSSPVFLAIVSASPIVLKSDLEQALPVLKKFPTDDLDHLWEIWEVYKNESRLGMESDRIRTCTCTVRRYHVVLYLYSFAIS